MDARKDEAVLFDGYKGNCHILVSVRKRDCAIFMRIGEYDHEYSSKQVAVFKFSVDDFYDLCTFFPNIAQKVRKVTWAMRDCGEDCNKINLLSQEYKTDRKNTVVSIIQKIVGLKV